MTRTVSTYKWWLIVMLWCVCFLNYADRQAIFALFPLLRTGLGLSSVQLGLVGSSFMWMYALFGPVAGWLGDRWSRRWLILGGLLLWVGLVFATSRAASFLPLLLLRACTGLGEAFYFPAAMSLIASFHSSQTRSRAMSIHQSAVYAGSIGGGSLAGLLGERWGWHSSFAFFADIGLVLAVILLFFLRTPARRGGDSPQELPHPSPPSSFLATARTLLANRLVIRLVLAFIGANFVAMVFMSWLPSFLHDKFHMSLSMSGLSGTLYLQLASILGVLTGGLLADRLARHHRGGRLMTQAIGLAAGVPFLVLTGWTFSAPTLLASMIGFGFAKGIYDANIFASLYDLVPPAQRASAAGLLNSLGWLGGGFAPVAIAYGSARLGMSMCLSLTSLIYAAVAVLLFSAARRLQKMPPLPV